MKIAGITVLVLAAMPMSFGASKEMIELQRDVAQLQDQARTMQKTLDQLTVIVQQALEVGNRSNTQLAVMERGLAEATKRVQEGVSQPLMGVQTKVDTLSEDYRNLRENVNDIGARMAKLDAKMTDLMNMMQVMASKQAPPPPVQQPENPNPNGPLTQPGQQQSNQNPSGPPAGLKSDRLYTDAVRDQTSGNYDVALPEFQDYVKYFGDTELAPNAQFYIGFIYYKRNDFANALQAFDTVLERYEKNPKTPSAHYWKGKTLLSMGKRDAAAKEFREVVNKFPDSDVVQAARTELRNLGLSAGEGTAQKSRSRRR